MNSVKHFVLSCVIALVSLSTLGTAQATTRQAASPLAAEQKPSVTATGSQQWISAIGNDRTDLLTELLERYEPSSLLSLRAPNGKSALMVASKKGHLSLASKLINAGADVHERTHTNGTAFMFAVLGNKREMAQWLVAKGADIHVVGSNGWSALTIAAAKGNVDLLQWLIALGADAQVRDVYRYTPLLRAVDNGYHEAAALLLTLPETEVNARDEFDNTALHHAVSARHVDLIRLLIKHNADVHQPNRAGVSPLELARGVNVLEGVLMSALPGQVERPR